MDRMSTRVAAPFDEVVTSVRTALADQGFGVLTEIDVKATMKAKLDEDIEQCVILGACNPTLAFQALSAEPSIATLLPCNVVVRETDTGVLVEAVDPLMMVGAGGDAVRPVAVAAAQRLSSVLTSLP